MSFAYSFNKKKIKEHSSLSHRSPTPSLHSPTSCVDNSSRILIVRQGHWERKDIVRLTRKVFGRNGPSLLSLFAVSFCKTLWWLPCAPNDSLIIPPPIFLLRTWIWNSGCDRITWVMSLCSCLWGTSWLSDAGRHIFLTSSTASWAEDPGLCARRKEVSWALVQLHPLSAPWLRMQQDQLLQALAVLTSHPSRTVPWTVSQSTCFSRELLSSEYLMFSPVSIS